MVKDVMAKYKDERGHTASLENELVRIKNLKDQTMLQITEEKKVKTTTTYH